MPKIFGEIQLTINDVIDESNMKHRWNPVDFNVFEVSFPRRKKLQNNPKTYPFTTSSMPVIHFKKRSASWSE